MDYGGPYTLTIRGKNTIEMTNVMIGEVWIFSGQSNMEFSVSAARNAEEEIVNASYPDINFFTVPEKLSQFPLDDVEIGEWLVYTSKTFSSFSAVGYLFRRKINISQKQAVTGESISFYA